MPVTQLKDEDVVALVRKEFERKLKDFCDAHGYKDPGAPSSDKDESEDEDSKKNDKEDDRNQDDKPKKPKKIDPMDLAPGIRVKHRDSQLVYTVVNLHLGTGQVDLETPEGAVFAIPAIQLEKEYGLD